MEQEKIDKALDGIKLVISMLQAADANRFKDLIDSMMLAEEIIKTPVAQTTLPPEPQVNPTVTPVKIDDVGLNPKRRSGGKVTPVKA